MLKISVSATSKKDGENTPQSGEYWYLDVRKETLDTWTGEIFSNQCVELGEYIDHDLFCINGQIISKRQYMLIGKWEPNSFWKLLGYK